ncbi:ATP-binding cassette domain-containing protein [Floricoccus penangensis]|uniref:ATP-binding cassette domain-containing protein n=1 Tax=Floricoccus penangensis TaxID=1859475 RepID=UPI002041EC63|nr:ABC transporter ATP-binding protein [Floricoccus penangensis]URZ86600.1 ABC transporter ATP-binding protein/permease [Floricoccus penangensis]
MKAQNIRHLIKYFKNLTVTYIILGILCQLLKSISILYYQKILDGFSKGLSPWSLLIYSTTLILPLILAYLSEYPKSKLYHGIYYFLKKEVLEKISHIDYLSYMSFGSGNLLQKIEAGASAGRSIYVDFYCHILRELLPSLIFNLLFISLIDLRVIPFIALGYLIVFLISKFLLKFLERIKRGNLINEEALNSILTRGVFEIVTFRINRRYKSEIRKYESLSEKVVDNVTSMTLIHELFFTIFAILVAIIQILLLALVLTGHISLTVGGLVAVLAYIDNIYTPIAIFNVIFVNYRLNKVSYERLAEFYMAPDDLGLVSEKKLFNEKITNVRLVDVGFSISNKEILRNLNLNFDKGKIYALTGKSGSGKSTCVKTILGLLKATSGEILINDRKLSSINLDDYYKDVFYISQEVPIFEGSLRENIIFENGKITDLEIIEALENCGLKNFFGKLEKGLDTSLGEKGLNVSGGERQRIAFTRLYFSQANLIIFDEATSAMDEKTEEFILNNVLPLLENKLTIMITHHKKNLKFVDEVVSF